MDLQKLIAMNCNQRNPILQLSDHLTQDQTFQEVIGNPSGLGLVQSNLMPPQSFRMDDLMTEMQKIEPQRVSMSSAFPVGVPSHCFPYTMPAMEYQNQFPRNSQTNEQMWYEMSAQHYENTTNNFYSKHLENGFPLPLSRFSQAQNFMGNNHRPAHLELKSEELVQDLMDIEDGITIDSLDELEDYVNQPDENCIAPVEKLEEPLPQPKTIIRKFPSAKSFRSYVKVEFINQCREQAWKLKHPNENYIKKVITQENILNPKEYVHIDNNPMKNISQLREKGMQAYKTSKYLEAFLYFDEDARKNKTSSDSWYSLSASLHACGKHDEAISAVKRYLRWDPSDYYGHILMSTIYYCYGCYYQACQSLFNWLKYSKSYKHLIPSNFTMDDKNTTELDKNQFNTVERIFLKAAQMNPTNPDGNLQRMIAELYKLSGDLDKVMDCRLTAINSKSYSNEILKVGKMLFGNEKPDEALNYLFALVQDDEWQTAAYAEIALVYMYLEKYRYAIPAMKKALGPVPLGEETKFELQENTLEAEYELCLRLYWNYRNK